MNFVFDLDGTICFKGQPVSEKILYAIERLTREGHQVIFASARPIRDMLPVLHKRFYNYLMIGGNGSLISKNGAIKKAHSFSPTDVKNVLSLIQEFKADFLIDGDWNYSYTGPADHPILQNVDPAHLAKRVPLERLASIVKVLILSSTDNKQLAKKLEDLNLFVNHHTNEDVLDISPKGISKWSALESLGVKSNSYIAFGNDANDLTMFTHAFHTVMIGYHEELSTLATERISMNGDVEQEIVKKITALSAFQFCTK